MNQVVIENPIINSPFDEPTRHFRFTDEGITNEEVEGRRTSSYFVPIAKPKKKGSKQLQFDTEWTQDRIEENKLVNDIRRRVAAVARGRLRRRDAYHGPPDCLLDRPRPREEAVLLPDRSPGNGHLHCRGGKEIRRRLDRERAPRGQRHVESRPATHGFQDGHRLRQDRGHGHAHRLAHAQQACQPAGRPLLRHFPDRHTRHHHPRPLRVLLPNDPQNYYRQRDIVPAQSMDQLGQAKIIITNFHAFQLREKVAAGKITKAILADGQPSPFTETPDQMVRRVCRELGTKKNIIVINDEAHHCYRRKPDCARTKRSRATSATKPRSATKRPASGFPASRP